MSLAIYAYPTLYLVRISVYNREHMTVPRLESALNELAARALSLSGTRESRIPSIVIPRKAHV